MSIWDRIMGHDKEKQERDRLEYEKRRKEDEQEAKDKGWCNCGQFTTKHMEYHPETCPARVRWLKLEGKYNPANSLKKCPSPSGERPDPLEHIRGWMVGRRTPCPDCGGHKFWCSNNECVDCKPKTKTQGFEPPPRLYDSPDDVTIGSPFDTHKLSTPEGK